MTPTFKEYCSYLTKYKELYGDKTTVLMQIGSFYEIYAVLTDELQLGETDIYNLCQNILNIAVVLKNNQTLMAGFQMPFATKFIKLLVDKGYTIVLVHQVTEPPNVTREVADIISPGTYLETYNQDESNYMMSIYIETISDWNSVGISVIDVSTGKNYVYQIPHSLDPNYWKDELNRFINYYSPKECLFQLNNLEMSLRDIENMWDVQHALVRVNHYQTKTFQKISYQIELLQKVFNFQTMISPIEQLDLVSTNESRISYVYMLQYIHDHKVDILRNIDLPEHIDDIHHLTLTSNSVRQLNVVNNYSYYQGKNDSLFSICNQCGFMGGKRLLKERLLYPLLDTTELTKRYDKIDMLRTDNFYKKLQGNLKNIHDVDKSLRKMGLSLLEPSDLLQMKISYEFINRILSCIETNTGLAELYSDEKPIIQHYRDYWTQLTTLFEFEHFYHYNGSLPKSLFKEGIYEELDAIEKTRIDSMKRLEWIQHRLSKIIDASNSCKLATNDKDGYYLYCTKKRSSLLKTRFANFPNHYLNIRDDTNEIVYEINTTDFQFVNKDKTNVFIQSPEINELVHKLNSVGDTLKKLNQQYWTKTIHTLYTTYGTGLRKLHTLIADIDVSVSISKISLEQGYCRPSFLDNSKSCFIAKDIRHPLVEMISDKTEYVPNDVHLGLDTLPDTVKQDGILLFGTNACGKSTLMKSIGLSVIMAQAGLYVPCSSFQYKPYTQLFTRILNNDNLFRSQSTFAVEMMELRSIFQLADENSLILGDELCSGTETMSALSIVSSSLEWLSSKRCSFMITSHLHQLNELSCIQSLDNLTVYHLKILYEQGLLCYDRKLCEGPGPAIYGLKVCEAMGLPLEFVARSNEILHTLTHQSSLVTQHQSCYHSDVYMDRCTVCGSTDSLETHHIKEQCLADESGMIGHHHKNKQHNLVPLCKNCHNKVTYGGLVVRGWKETSQGRVLDYEFVTREYTQSKKYTQEQINIILSYKPKVDSGIITKKTCLNLLDIDHGFRPSTQVINEVFSGTY